MMHNRSPQIGKAFNLLIADDHELLREGVRSVFREVPWAQIIGAVHTAAEAFSFIESSAPDLVMLNPFIAGADGISCVRQMCSSCSGVKVVLFTDRENDDWIYDYLKAGVEGVILKKTSCYDLVTGVRSVLEGKTYLSPDILMNVTRRFIDGNPPSDPIALLEYLTKREREVFELVGQGRKNREIAQDLFISIKTVEKHRANMMRKLRLRGPIQVRRLWSDWVASS